MQDNEPDGKKVLIDLCKTNCIESIRISSELGIAHLNAVIGFAKIAINGALLLNGTAGIAILCNLKSLPKEMHFPLLLCAIGAACAVCCAGVSYVTQRLYFRDDEKKSNIEIQRQFNDLNNLIFPGATKKKIQKAKRSFSSGIWNIFAILFWLASIALFAVAVYQSRAVLLALFPSP